MKPHSCTRSGACEIQKIMNSHMQNLSIGEAKTRVRHLGILMMLGIAGWTNWAVGQEVLGPYQLTADPPNLDLGVVLDTPVIEQPFVIQNTGILPIQITGVGMNCDGCASFHLDRDTLEPDDFAVLDLQFDPAGLSGDIRLLIAIRTDGLVSKPLVIPVVAHVRPQFALVGVPVRFREMQEGEVRQWRVEVVPGVQLPGPLLRADSDSSSFRAVVAPVPGRESFMATIEVGPLDVPGIHEGTIRLEGEGGVSCEIPVSAFKVPDFHYFPGRIVVEPWDEEQFRILFIRQTGNPAASITGIRVPNRHIKYEIFRDRGFSNYRINLYTSGLSETNGLVGYVEVDTDRDVPGTIQVPVFAQSLNGVPVEQTCLRGAAF